MQHISVHDAKVGDILKHKKINGLFEVVKEPYQDPNRNYSCINQIDVKCLETNTIFKNQYCSSYEVYDRKDTNLKRVKDQCKLSTHYVLPDSMRSKMKGFKDIEEIRGFTFTYDFSDIYKDIIYIDFDDPNIPRRIGNRSLFNHVRQLISDIEDHLDQQNQENKIEIQESSLF